MTSKPQTITDRRTEFNSLLARWKEFYASEIIKLVNFLRSQGYTDEKIAEVMDISGQVLGSKYPREVHEN